MNVVSTCSSGYNHATGYHLLCHHKTGLKELAPYVERVSIKRASHHDRWLTREDCGIDLFTRQQFHGHLFCSTMPNPVYKRYLRPPDQLYVSAWFRKFFVRSHSLFSFFYAVFASLCWLYKEVSTFTSQAHKPHTDLPRHCDSVTRYFLRLSISTPNHTNVRIKFPLTHYTAHFFQFLACCHTTQQAAMLV